MPEALLPTLKEKGFKYVGLDVQGFTRQLHDGKVNQGDWVGKDKYLPYIDILKIDNKESLMLFGTANLQEGSLAALRMGVSTVVATSAEGVLFSTRKPHVAAGPAPGLSADDCMFEWREWKLPRTPECRTGRGLYLMTFKTRNLLFFFQLSYIYVLLFLNFIPSR